MLVGWIRFYHLVRRRENSSNKEEENGGVVSYWPVVQRVPGSNPYSPTPCFDLFYDTCGGWVRVLSLLTQDGGGS